MTYVTYSHHPACSGRTSGPRDQTAHPTRTGSGTRSTPNASRTPPQTLRASSSTSDAVAPPRLVRASVCAVESAAGPGNPKPRPKPACSINHAALVLTRWDPAGYLGASAGRPAASVSSSTGFVKNEPALQVSWFEASSTIPLA